MIKENVSLKKLNTFGIDVTARYFSSITDEESLLKVLEQQKGLRQHGAIPLFILGGGSNILLTKDFDGLVLFSFPAVSMIPIILLIMTIAFLAATLPARRASRLNPIDALRYE